MRPPSIAKVGPVSHVSCIDLAPAPQGEGSSLTQLKSFGLARLESLCNLFGARPARVMARCADETSEVFLELQNGVQIQYFGALTGGHSKQRLWVEGSRGSLLQDGALLWWRKRGWPKFLPWGLQLRNALARGTQDGKDTLFAAIQRAHEEGRVVSLVA